MNSEQLSKCSTGCRYVTQSVKITREEYQIQLVFITHNIKFDLKNNSYVFNIYVYV